MSITLPVYELGRASVDSTRLSAFATNVFGIEQPVLQERTGRLVVAENGISVELFAASGTIFAADSGRLRVVSDRPALPSAEDAYALSADLTKRHGLDVDLGIAEFELTRLTAGGTIVASRTGRRRSQHALDVR